GSLSRYSKSTVRRHRRVSHFEVEFAIYLALCTTGLPLILSVIEFIRVLCLTQEEFDRRYNYRPISAFSWVW
ncbi:hypothetical protein, partial [Aeromonas rivipollensis]|uniref:hypothetical protein n=1 Tax=Aeromonas rivipollensis TaxID=948519 RepID=UPI003D1D6E88